MTPNTHTPGFPVEVKQAVTNISSDTHFAVLNILINTNTQSFTGIHTELSDVPQETLDEVLTDLQQAGVIKHTVTAYKEHYEVTTLGERIITNLLDAIEITPT